MRFMRFMGIKIPINFFLQKRWRRLHNMKQLIPLLIKDFSYANIKLPKNISGKIKILQIYQKGTHYARQIISVRHPHWQP